MTTSKVAKRRIDKNTKKKPQARYFQLKITLTDAPLPIWRRVVVNPELPLSIIHEIFQICMGWWNYHLHDFAAHGRHFGDIEATDYELEVEDDTAFNLLELVKKPGDSFVYEYDFGDFWSHRVTLEHIHNVEQAPFAQCMVGKRACPPEDVGGIAGYARFLEIIEDPEHPERAEYLTWCGGEFDPDSFDVRITNLRLEELRQELVESVQDA